MTNNVMRFKYNLKKTLVSWWPLIIILLYSFVPLSWFKNGYLLAGGDEMEYLNPGMSFTSYLYAWLNKFNAGAPNISLYSIFPYKFFWFFLQGFEFSNLLIEKLWVVLLFILPGISMYFLVSFLMRNYSEFWANLAALVSSTFYMFNIFITLNPIQSNTRLVQFGLPLCLYFWIKALNFKHFTLKYPIYIGLVTVLITSANANLVLVALLPITFCLYALFWFFYNLNRKAILHLFKYAVFTLVVWLSFNLWWIVNLYFLKAGGIVKGLETVFEQSGYLSVTPIWDSLRLMGYWAFRGSFEGRPHIPYAQNYYQQPLLALTFLVPFFAFLPLFFKKKQKEMLFFLLVALVGVFLAKGIQSPWGGFYKFLTQWLPYFWLFRDPFSKFTLLHLLAYSVLFGFVVVFVSGFEKRKLFFKSVAVFLFLFFVSLALTTSYTLLTGEVFNLKDIGTNRSLHAAVPQYWHEASFWFRQNDPNVRVFLLPKAAYGMSYNWRSGISGAGYVANFLLPNPLIGYVHNSSRQADEAASNLYHVFSDEKKTDVNFALKSFDIKYILHQGDIASDSGLFFKSGPTERVRGILESKEGITKVRSFGPLDLYEVDNFQENRIFASSCFHLTLDHQTLLDHLTSDTKAYDSFCPVFVLSALSEDQRNFLLSLRNRNSIYPLGFSGLKSCSLCPEKIGVDFKYLLSDLTDMDYFFGKVKEAGLVEIRGRESVGQGVILIATFPVLGLKSVSSTEPWYFVQDLKEGAIFETVLPEEFPQELISDKNKSRFFAVIHNNQPLKMLLLGDKLSAPGEALVGSISPRRLVVSTESKVEGDYTVLYLDSLPKDPLWLPSLGETDVNKEQVLPLVAFKKINPTQYKIEVKNASSPFSLYFLEGFSPFWKAQVESADGRKEKISESLHLISLGYANSWFVNKIGDFKIVLFYKPQLFLFVASLISLVAVISAIFYLFVSRKKKDTQSVLKKESHPSKRFFSVLLFLSRILFISFASMLVAIVIYVGKGDEVSAKNYGSFAFFLLFFSVFFNMLSLKWNNEN